MTEWRGPPPSWYNPPEERYENDPDDCDHRDVAFDSPVAIPTKRVLERPVDWKVMQAGICNDCGSEIEREWEPGDPDVVTSAPPEMRPTRGGSIFDDEDPPF